MTDTVPALGKFLASTYIFLFLMVTFWFAKDAEPGWLTNFIKNTSEQD
jgi:hypothetical protein